MKNITYAVNKDGIYARCGDRMAFFELDYKNMKPENNFKEKYTISDYSVFEFCEQNLRWTKKIPLHIKNAFRKHFGMSELKMTPSYYLIIDIESGKYLKPMVGHVLPSFTSSLSKAFKPVKTPSSLITVLPDCFIVEMK